MKAMRILALLLIFAGLAGCSNMSEKEQRMLSGGAIGAAGGAALGAVTGGSWVLGGLIGGAVGTAAGAIVK
jgi:hypothetical protein